MGPDRRPIVGIVAKYSPRIENRSPDRPYALFDDEMKQALIDAGVVTIGIMSPKRHNRLTQIYQPLSKCLLPAELENLRTQLSLCQGIVLLGGHRIAEYEYAVADLAYQLNMPTLGVCRGQTIMGRVLGADNIKVDGTVHDQPKADYVHDITVLSGTQFHDIVQTDTMRVNSRHNYELIANDKFRASAISPDGYAEVTESPDKKFYMGVRFHPESLYRHDPLMQRIFEAFVASL